MAYRKPKMTLFSAFNPVPGWVVMLAAALLSMPAYSETRYVTDQFEITMRTGPSTDNSIVRMLSSGAGLELINSDTESGYSEVRTSGGTRGFVLTRYLVRNPVARAQLATLQERVAALRDTSGEQGRTLDDLRQQNIQYAEQIAQLETDKANLEAELSEIRETAADVLAINDQNRTLMDGLSRTQERILELEQTNERLVSRHDQNWFLIGAAVLLGGIFLGIVLPRIPRKRRKSWSNSF